MSGGSASPSSWARIVLTGLGELLRGCFIVSSELLSIISFVLTVHLATRQEKASYRANGTFYGLCRGRKCRFWFWKPSCGSRESSCALCRDIGCSASVGETCTLRHQRHVWTSREILTRTKTNSHYPDQSSPCSAHDHSRCTCDTPVHTRRHTHTHPCSTLFKGQEHKTGS